MSSTNLAFRGIAVGAVYNNNIITWDIYKRYGWNPSDLDGYYNNKAGGVVYAGYRYDGNVIKNFRTTMSAYSSARYENVYTVAEQSTTLHMWSDRALCANGLVIVL